MDDFCDDDRLVAALRAGDENAFGWMLDRYDASLHRVARSFLDSPAAIDEVVQDTWLAVIEGIDRFEQRSTVKTWLFHIMANKARTRGSRDKRSVPFSSLAPERDGPSFDPDRFRPLDDPEFPGHWASPPAPWESLPEDRLESRETLDRIRLTITDLPEPHRRVLTLRDVHGMSSTEVCEILGLTPSNERVLLHRARSRVRAALERYFTEEET